MASLMEKVDACAAELGVGSGNIPERIEKIAAALGVAKELNGKPLMEQADICHGALFGKAAAAPTPVVAGVSVASSPQMVTLVAGAATEVASSNGRIEFLGLWKDTGNRAMPIKMQVNPRDANQVRRAFDTLVGEMRRTGVSSGILAAQSFNQMHWSANPNETGYKKHGFIGTRPDQATGSSWSKRTHRNEGMRFDGFDGVINVLGGDWQNAVYRVSLGTGTRAGTGGAGGGGQPLLPLSMDREAPQAPSAIRVSGASPTYPWVEPGAFNDTWTRCHDINGRPAWQRRGNPQDFIKWDGSKWTLNGTTCCDNPTYVNYNFNDGTPPRDGWAPGCAPLLCFPFACLCGLCPHVPGCGYSPKFDVPGSARAGGGAAADGRVTSHDMRGTWLICAPPCGWGVYGATPYENDPNRYHEKGMCMLCMVLPVPSDEVWTRDQDTNTFRKDKNSGDAITFCCSCYGNEKGWIHKCKICPG